MAGELVVGILYNLFLPLLLLAGESAYSFNSHGCDVFVCWRYHLLNLSESECVGVVQDQTLVLIMEPFFPVMRCVQCLLVSSHNTEDKKLETKNLIFPTTENACFYLLKQF